MTNLREAIKTCAERLDRYRRPGQRIGELGVGCNPGITRYMRNVYFDEKLDGTVHIALGFGFPDIGGTNESAVHWDMVCDLRKGGRITVDGDVLMENGKLLV